MRLIIEADFKIDEIDEEQSKQLEDFSVRFSKEQDSIVIHEQKIDLEMSDMEDSIEDFLIGDIAQYRSDFVP